jgi:hypothetical protein
MILSIFWLKSAGYFSNIDYELEYKQVKPDLQYFSNLQEQKLTNIPPKMNSDLFNNSLELVYKYAYFKPALKKRN